MLHLDLFSGIGGFAYAVDQVWEAEHIFCEVDPFCREVLDKHWPGSLKYGDIKTITDTERQRWGQRRKPEERQTPRRNNNPDLLTGGFPCQPFSAAGVRRGTADERYLWPEMLRVIRLTQPSWVIAENVRGLLTWESGLVFQQICSDLETSGYEAQPFIIPAVAVNAPHRRDRIWWIACNPEYARRNGSQDNKGVTQGGDSNQARTDEPEQSQRPDILRQAIANPNNGESRPRNVAKPIQTQEQERSTDSPTNWDKDWLEVAAKFCRVDDGLPNRTHRLKALGNAIVPQIAVEIMRGIALSQARR